MTTLVPDISDSIIDSDDQILVTGGTGFIGKRLLRTLQSWGFKKVRCLVRSSAGFDSLNEYFDNGENGSRIEFFTGNLLSREDCERATEDVSVIYHLAAGTVTKSFADAFLNSVVSTRNLLDGALHNGYLRRFVNVSTLAVYTNENKRQHRILDEECPTEIHPELRGDAYCFAKTKQDELLIDYGKKHRLPYVLVRPGVVYGPGKKRIPGRVGIDPFGIFLHLGGSNPIPLTFVENCAEAIVLAGLKKGIEGHVFNVTDDDLPSSRQFLKMYKKEVNHFRSLYVPHFASYVLCFLWESYSAWSKNQLLPVYNRKVWASFWKKTFYSNEKIKNVLGWRSTVSTAEGLKQYFVSCRENGTNA